MNRFLLKMIFLVFLVSNLFSQNLKSGVSVSLIGGNISEPVLHNNNIIYRSNSWSALQFGISVEYILHRARFINLKGTTGIAYAEKMNAFYEKFHITSNRHSFETWQKTNLNYFITLNQTFMLSYNLTKIISLDFGLSILFKTYEFEDIYFDIFDSNGRTLTMNNFKIFRFSPIIQSDIRILKNLSLIIGLNYNFNEELYEELRIAINNNTTGTIQSYYAKKTLNKFDCFFKFMYIF